MPRNSPQRNVRGGRLPQHLLMPQQVDDDEYFDSSSEFDSFADASSNIPKQNGRLPQHLLMPQQVDDDETEYFDSSSEFEPFADASPDIPKQGGRLPQHLLMPQQVDDNETGYFESSSEFDPFANCSSSVEVSVEQREFRDNRRGLSLSHGSPVTSRKMPRHGTPKSEVKTEKLVFEDFGPLDENLNDESSSMSSLFLDSWSGIEPSFSRVNKRTVIPPYGTPRDSLYDERILEFSDQGTPIYADYEDVLRNGGQDEYEISSPNMSLRKSHSPAKIAPRLNGGNDPFNKSQSLQRLESTVEIHNMPDLDSRSEIDMGATSSSMTYVLTSSISLDPKSKSPEKKPSPAPPFKNTSIIEWFDQEASKELEKRTSNGEDQIENLVDLGSSSLTKMDESPKSPNFFSNNSSVGGADIINSLRSEPNNDLLKAIDKLVKAVELSTFDGAVRAAEAAAASVPPELAEEAAVVGAQEYKSEIVDVVEEKFPGIKPIEVLGYVGITRPTKPVR